MAGRTAVPVSEVPEPIINSPYVEPTHHWQVAVGKSPVKAEGRRPAYYFYRVPEGAGTGRKNKRQAELLGETDIGSQEELGQVNLIRQRLNEWRAGKLTGTPYDGTSRVTKELIDLWRGDADARGQRLFFAQIEAAETIIFLVEAADVYKKGLVGIPKDEPGPEGKAKGLRAFTRYASKMATGSGKTTVMGMLAAWSILNRVAAPTDDRFSDTVLIVCPNVTIRERLRELDPLLGDLSLYRTRQLVPVQRMEELRRGEVMIANWHKLAKLESNTVNGDSAKVVKTGEAVEITKQSGKDKGKVEVKYFESDAAWFKRMRQELGTQSVIGSLYNALQSGTEEKHGFLPVIPQGSAGLGSTLYVDFHTTKPVRAVTKCHLNLMVADTAKWEQSAGFLLDIHPGIVKWVKNDRLGFAISYRKQNIKHSYVPDFIAELDIGMKVIIEVKGQYNDDADLKAKAAQRWVDAVNRSGEHGLWHYMVVQDPSKLGVELNQLSLDKLQGNAA